MFPLEESPLTSEVSPLYLLVAGYSRLGGSMGSLGTSMYPGASYPTSEQNPYPSIAMDNSAFYGSLVSREDIICFVNLSGR